MDQDYLAKIFGTATNFDHPFFKRPDLLTSYEKEVPDSYLEGRKARFTFLSREVWSDVFHLFNLLRLDNVTPSKFDISEDGAVTIDIKADDLKQYLSPLVNELIPWRKGPWRLNNFFIDSEWKSNIKYADIQPLKHLFKSKRLLDIGGGNGYYAIRSIFDLADSALIFDPSEKFFFQFELIQKFLRNPRAQYEIGGYQEARQTMLNFDVLFCLGVFYHQKHPLDLIESCRKLLEMEGILFLESMIIEGNKSELFFPPDRYAKARNVYFLPTIDALNSILRRTGFGNIELVSLRETNFNEQRSTVHMPYESLEQFIDTKNQDITIEGYQRPKRALIIAKKK